MTTLWLAPVVLTAALWVARDRLARLLPPPSATILLTGLALSAALGTLLMLGSAGVLALAQVPVVARLGQWSAPTVGKLAGVPFPIGVAAGAVGAGLALRATLAAGRRGQALVRVAVAAAALAPGSHGLRVLDDEVPDAFAVAGRRGYVVVTTAMLRALEPAERRCLLAHEASHLRHRHHVYVQLAHLAACANPLLVPVAAAVRLSVERWADEDAASTVGDRRLVARSLGRAAAARQHMTGHPGALAAADHHVVARVRFLLDPATPRRPLITAGLTTVILACSAAAVVATGGVHGRVESAETVYLAADRHDQSPTFSSRYPWPRSVVITGSRAPS